MVGRRRPEVVRTVLAALVLVGMCRSARGLDQEADWPPEPALGRLTLRPPLPGRLYRSPDSMRGKKLSSSMRTVQCTPWCSLIVFKNYFNFWQ